MASFQKRIPQKKANAAKKRLSPAQLDAMIEEATVDCYNESEACTGIFCMLEENLQLPFTTMVLGLEVSVDSVDITDADEVVAICRKGNKRQRISLVDLPLPDPRPRGADWIDAYRRWAHVR
jgi:hypothetical protein